MSVDRRAINVLLAGLDIEQRDLAEAMGYRPGYVANVLNGLTPVSKAFRGAFGQVLAELLLGPEDPGPRRYPAGPLVEMVRRRAEQVARKTDLYRSGCLPAHTGEPGAAARGAGGPGVLRARGASDVGVRA